MVLLKLFFSYILSVNTVYAENSKEDKLTLTCVESKILLGNTVYLSLIISGGIVDNIIDDSCSLLKPDDNETIYDYRQNSRINHKLKGFEYFFEVKPKKIGKYTLGPYTINFQNKELISNSLTIEIFNPPKSEKALFLSADNNAPKVNSEFSIELTGSNEWIKKIGFINNDFFKETSNSSSSSMTIINGIIKSKYSKKFILKALKPGKIIIDQNYFHNILDDFFIYNLEMRIKL